jgi:predicted dienelactone hydrolase
MLCPAKQHSIIMTMPEFVRAGVALFVLLAAGTTFAGPVGEMHRVTADPTASLRDAQQRTELRVTVWYPAVADAVERDIVVGAPGEAIFRVGSVAPDAAFASDTERRPVILFSHGYGGTARLMGWFGIAMARDGYIVISVDHPGNNGLDTMTPAGAALWWDRAEDLRLALKAVAEDPVIGPHMDLSRVGAAGFSAGGFTALVATGARVDRAHFARFCDANPDDGVCRPQPESNFTAQDYADLFKRPDIQAELSRAADDHSIKEVRAAFVMAPALVQALQPSSLEHLSKPVEIMLGDLDTTAPPATNGLAAVRMIPNASLTELSGVGHLDFLSTCTKLGLAKVPICKTRVPQDDTHARAIKAAEVFFDRQLGVMH